MIVDLAASRAATIDAALRQVANEVAARFGIEVDVRIPNDDGEDLTELGPNQREDVVRIAREAIVNAARHGSAHHVGLRLDCTDDQVRLRISDDGRGMPQGKLGGRGGYGMQMMRARATALGGHLVTRPSAQGGVEVEVTFPRRLRNADDASPCDDAWWAFGDAAFGAGRSGGRGHVPEPNGGAR